MIGYIQKSFQANRIGPSQILRETEESNVGIILEHTNIFVLSVLTSQQMQAVIQSLME